MAELRQRSPGAYPHGEEEEEGDDDEEAVEDDDDELIETNAEQINASVPKKLADVQRTPKRKSLSKATRYPPAPKSWYTFTWFKFVAVIVISATSAVFSAYKRDSAYIGFCDHGSNSNLRIHELRAQRQKNQIEAARCYNKLNFTSIDAVLNNEYCSPLPLHTPLEADTCTPCPKFAFCTPDSVTCQSSYILKPHPLAALGPALNGFPGLGSVAFPPKCVQDREKLKRIGGLVDGMESWLAMTRGTRVCSGVKVPTDERDGGEAKVFGLEKESLREAVKRKTKRDAENADEIFERVLADLDKFGMIVKGTDIEGFEYIAAVRADFTLPCRIKVTAREAWEANRRRVYAFLVFMASLFYLRSRALASAAESRKVAGLVQEALDMLQEQEFGYHADPVTTTEPYIVPVHLRDLILKDEHSPKVRQRVWEKVAKIVEGNANVRTNEEEVRGEYTKVWRWVGSVGTPARSRRVSFADRSMRSLIDDEE
ncbi:inner nuclear membrane protein enriched at telomere/subtelomere region [Tulasnella sp. 408]|nr:inner nuclear membrane protein enriched at telomere/subtelomere region [Tulasnella sp. 408]